jgi:hypothetical protein
MKHNIPSPAYVEQARLLSKEEAERVFSRMRKKLSYRLEQETIDPLEAVALQLQHEDEQLDEWRENLTKLRKAHARKAEAKR